MPSLGRIVFMQFARLGGILALVIFAVSTLAAGPCGEPVPSTDWIGWSASAGNSRYQANPGFQANAIPRLKLKWAFGFPGDTSAFAQPVIWRGRVLTGSESGTVYSLDARTGCTLWTYRAGAGVRTALPVTQLRSGRWAAFFGDLRANAYAVDAETGTLLWKVKLDQHRAARITGSPTLWGDRLYVPISSNEEALANDPRYPCCTFRGSVAALDIETGMTVWKTYTIRAESKPYAASKAGTELRGPAGAAVWSAPTIDAHAKRIYIATGNSYTGVESGTSDAVLTLDLDTGKLLWSTQPEPGDNYINGCPFHPNCPAEPGGDLDFGASPMLRALSDGQQLLIAGQKSGVVYGIDERGKIVWRTRVGAGGALGGILWGLAADPMKLYAAVSDRLLGDAGTPGVYALDPATGHRLWMAGAATHSAAVSAMPGAVFAGDTEGHLRAYASEDGRVLWDFDTNRAFQAVNGAAAHGGSIDGPGAILASGMVFVTSGYSRSGGMPGNVLLAFSVDGD